VIEKKERMKEGKREKREEEGTYHHHAYAVVTT
jgi:hypothetical protein